MAQPFDLAQGRVRRAGVCRECAMCAEVGCGNRVFGAWRGVAHGARHTSAHFGTHLAIRAKCHNIAILLGLKI